MDSSAVTDPKVTVLLAGPGSEEVFRLMQAPFQADARFSIISIATQWDIFVQNLAQMRPALVVLQVDLAPGADALLQRLSEMQVWQGVAILVIPPALRDLRPTYEKSSVVRGAYIAPANWGEVAQAGFAAAMNERARLAAAAPLQQAYSPRIVNGPGATRVIAFLSATGGTGRSTIAESLAYELKFRRSANTLLLSFDLPPAAVSHLRLRYVPNAIEYFARPGDGFAAAIQSREGLDVIVAPENSIEYQRAADHSTSNKSGPSSIYSLVMTSWTRNYAAVLLDLPAGEQPWSLQGLMAANTAVIVSRCTLADMTAARHSMVLLLERLISEHRIPREAIYLVLNQVSENSPISPREFHDELANCYGWAPPVVAVIPYLPAISQAQDSQVPAVTRVEGLAKAIRNLAEALYPGSVQGQDNNNGHNGKAKFRLPTFRFT